MSAAMPTPPETPDRRSCAEIIEAAIHELMPTDWYRLRQAARILAWKVPSTDGEGLLMEALERTLDGRRHWRSEACDFVTHLIGAMRSIASHEAARRGLDTVSMTSSIDLIADGDLERQVDAEARLRQLRDHFGRRGDHSALGVLDAMELGCDGPAIRAALSMSQTELETIVRRIRRVALRLIPP